MTAPAIAKPVTEKQLYWINKLAAERELPGITLDADTIAAIKTAKQASALLDMLFKAPMKAAKVAKVGFYLDADGGVIEVKANKAGTATYAMRLVIEGKKGCWVYAPGLGKTLAGLEPLTVAQAAAMGQHHGVCVICAKELTDPKSIAKGIGPVCEKNTGLVQPPAAPAVEKIDFCW